MAVLLLRNRKRTDELCRREGLDGRAHKSGAVTRDDKVHAGTLGHRTDTAVLKVRLIGIGGGKTSLLVERLYRVALKAVAHYLAPARLEDDLVVRTRVADLPQDFTLDDSMALSPEFKLSSAGTLRIEARVSKSGDATARPGDLRGESGPVQPGASKLGIVIDTRVE